VLKVSWKVQVECEQNNQVFKSRQSVAKYSWIPK